MKPNDPWTLCLAATTLALVAALAGFLPARRASRLDPMTALRDGIIRIGGQLLSLLFPRKVIHRN